MDLTQTSLDNNNSLSLTNNNTLQILPPSMVVSYKECLKNHAANIGGHALDGCGEFMPAGTALKCAACGCHRNFHRRHNNQQQQQQQLFLPYYPHHQAPTTTQSPTPSQSSGNPSSPQAAPSPSPVPFAYYASAPNMLLALSTTTTTNNHENNNKNNKQISSGGSSSVKKRSRSKFSEEQKSKMFAFAEKLNWTMQRSDSAGLIHQCCVEAGVCREVFKVWMHNHKKRSDNNKNADNNKPPNQEGQSGHL